MPILTMPQQVAKNTRDIAILRSEQPAPVETFAVQYIPQVLNNSQKSVARNNIGSITRYNFSITDFSAPAPAEEIVMKQVISEYLSNASSVLFARINGYQMPCISFTTIAENQYQMIFNHSTSLYYIDLNNNTFTYYSATILDEDNYYPSRSTTLTIGTTDWVGDTYIYDIPQWVGQGDNIFITPKSPNDAINWANADIFGELVNDTIIFTCDETPTSNIDVNICIVYGGEWV